MANSTGVKTRPSLQDLEDAFVKVTFQDDRTLASADKATDPFYDQWINQASALFDDPSTFAARALRELYPNHSIVLFNDLANFNVLSFPGAIIQPASPPDLISSLYFAPIPRRMGQVPGKLIDQIKFGSFNVAWSNYDFIMYIVKYPHGFGDVTQSYLLHEGPEERSRALLMAAGAHSTLLHEEILVFNQGNWYKDHALWVEIQKANWDDVILKQEFKDAMRKDINGFFGAEELYKSLAIPWKRGIIMFGPPGNGKTISLKAVMKECDAKGYAPLYVKSFQSWRGEEGSMAAVFEKAREMAPCVVVLEDLDSLINDRNRSFFLNQMDGLEGNDGLLVIGSTNHYDKLDPALNSRPSRFDRKYPFDDPDEEERTLYVQYWQDKLRSNKSISFPDSLVHETAAATDKFSFAYLKEVFVSSLVLLAGCEGDKPSFDTVLRAQIKLLRGQIGKEPNHGAATPVGPAPPAATPATPSLWRLKPFPAVAAEPMDARAASQGRVWDTSDAGMRLSIPGGLTFRKPIPVKSRSDAESSARPATLGGTGLGRSFIC